MSNRQTFGAAFLGGLVGSNRSLQRWVARFAWRILLGILMLPLVVLTWLNVPPALAVRLTAAFWVGLLGLLLIRVVMRWVAPWVARALDGSSFRAPTMFRPGAAEPTWVYWLFDDAGLFLYVGISNDVDRRMAQHAVNRDEAHWWWRVDESRTVTRRYASRDEAKAIETAYIRGRRELPRPMHNRMENTA